MERDDHLGFLQSDITAFAAAIERGPLDAPIAACPGWDVAELARHLGMIHRWARTAIITAQRPTGSDDDPAPSDPLELAGWLRSGGLRLIETLREVDPEAPTWHPFPVPRVAGMWPRRQAQEASVHRWDVEQAIGLAPTIDAGLAVDGIDEYYLMMLPRLVSRESLPVPAAAIGVLSTDTGRRWLVGSEDRVPCLVQNCEPSAEVAGTAEHLLLRLWGRPVPDGSIIVSGSQADADAWLALGGA